MATADRLSAAGPRGHRHRPQQSGSLPATTLWRPPLSTADRGSTGRVYPVDTAAVNDD